VDCPRFLIPPTESINNDSQSHCAMAERHAKADSKYEWSWSAVILSVLFTIQALAPVAVADADFDEMTICQDSPSTLGGVCDDRMDAADGTPDVTEWVEGMFHFNMSSPTEIQFQASWAIREWSKGGLGLFSSPEMTTALQSDNIMANDGLPADVLRSSFDENTDPNDPDSPTVQELLMSEIDGSISSFLLNWGGSSTPETSWRNSIYLPDDSGNLSQVACELDPLQDSDGNAFDPPICISTNVTITLDVLSTYGLAVSPSDLNTALEGLLIMGSEITTNFDVKVQPGHLGVYAIQPPSYATVSNAGGWVGEEIPEDGGAYKSALWTVDNRDASTGVLQADLDMSMAYREKEGTDVVEISPLEKSLDLRVTVDLSDESASFIEVIVGIYQIQASTLTNWGVPALMPPSKATVPVITSDGIRMAYHTGLLDLTDLSSNMPVSGIGDALGSSEGSSGVSMGGFTWMHVSQAPLDQGGLNYTHGPPCTRGQHFCMEGPVAMDDSYPVYMRSISHTFPLSLADLLGGNLGDSGFLNSVSGDDFGKLLNSGMEFSTTLSDAVMEDFVGSLLPNGVSADLTMSIVLPEWASTMDGGDTMQLSYRSSGNHDAQISLTGSEAFSWDHAICRQTASEVCFDSAPDVVCPSTSRSCGYIDVDWDLQEVSFGSLPLTKGGSVQFALSVDLVIHRIGVPDVLFDSINTDSTTVDLDTLPADLFRALLEIGSRGDPIEVEFSLCDEGMSFCEQAIPFSSSNSTGLPAYAEKLEKDIASLIEYSTNKLTEDPNNDFGNIDMSELHVEIGFPHEMITDNDDVIGDERGIILSVDIPDVRVTTGVDNSWFEIIKMLQDGSVSPKIGIETADPTSALLSPFLTPMFNAMNGLTGALSASMVSADGIRSQEKITLEFPTSDLSDIGEEGALSGAGLDLTGFINFSMPLGITLEDYSSSQGLLTAEIDGTGRQVISYEIGPSMINDNVEFNVLISPMWILQQIQYYLIGLIGFLLWRVRRRMTRKARKRRAESLIALEESLASSVGYVPPQPTVEVLQVSDNGIVVKRRLVAT